MSTYAFAPSTSRVPSRGEVDAETKGTGDRQLASAASSVLDDRRRTER